MTLQVLSMRDIVEAEMPDYDSLLGEGLIVPNGKVVGYGPPESYKSIYAQQLLYKLSQGEDFLGHTVHKAVNTWYVELEIAERQFQIRTQHMASYGGGVSDKAYYSHPHVFILSDNKAADALIEQANQYEIEVLFLDPLNLILNGSENNDEHIRELMHMLDRVRERAEHKPAVGIIHHSNKGLYSADGQAVDRGFNEVSGSKGIIAWPDTIFNLKRVKSPPLTVRETWQKARYQTPPEPQWLTFSEEKVMLEFAEDGPEGRLKAFLRDNSPASTVEVDEQLRLAGLSQAGARNYRKQATAAGWLDEQPDPTQHRAKLYRLAEGE